MLYSRTLNSWMTGASAAMVALTTISHFLIQRDIASGADVINGSVWLMIAASAAATLLVMSILQSNVSQLYNSLAEKENTAREDALTDPLTRLGNRKFLAEKLQERTLCHGPNHVFALLFLDLDHFKRVNDTLGHAAGDALIVEVADRLREFSSEATIARLGGDEFAIILDRTDPDELASFCRDCVNSLADNYLISGNEIYVGVSIGAVVFDGKLTTSDLMRRADVAMYKAKSDRNGYQIFDSQMILDIERRVLLEKGLRSDLRSGDNISALFLPQFDRLGEINRLELLIRWNHPTLGSIPAPEIISVAEDAGLISEIGLFIARQACEAGARLPGQALCLNIAAKQLLDDRFTEQLVELLRAHGQSPERFQLDISEHILVTRADEIRPALQKLVAAGFKLAADDFGTSMSSLIFLQKLGITAIKLDRSLLRSAVDLQTIAVIRAIVSLAKTLQFAVTCEGISTTAEKSAALNAGCDHMQGHLFGKPVPLGELIHTASSAQPNHLPVLARQHAAR